MRYLNYRVYSDRPILAFTTDLNYVLKIWCFPRNLENLLTKKLYFVLWEAFLCRRACYYWKCSHIWSFNRWYYRAMISAFSRPGLNDGLGWMLEKCQISPCFRLSSYENMGSILKDPYPRKRLKSTMSTNVKLWQLILSIRVVVSS